MNEVKSPQRRPGSLKSPRTRRRRRRQSTPSSSTWYDIAPPVIVHNRPFDEEQVKETMEDPKSVDTDKIEDGKMNGKKKRHSSSVLLTATNTLETDQNGVPKITFSFFESGELRHDEIYDVPKSPSRNGINNSLVTSGDDGSEKWELARDDLYDIPSKPTDEISKSAPKLDENREDGSPEIGHDEAEPKTETGGAVLREDGQRLRIQRRRIGKAWGRVRSWLREERLKLSEVMARHVRMQAAAAGRLNENHHQRARCRGSYDLTKAQARENQEVGSLTRVEEFGLESVYEIYEEPRPKKPNSLGKKTFSSSDDILGDSMMKRSLPTSFSLERLECPEKTTTPPTTTTTTTTTTTSAENATGKGNGLLVKRRMLGSIRGLIASTHLLQTYEIEEGGQGGFEDVRKYVKQGGDLCKELAAILHERAELEANYAKGLTKLSCKLTKACTKDQGGNSTGGVNEAWRCIGEEMEASAEAHRVWGVALGEQLAKPLRVGVAEAQARTRKSIENSVDKAQKSLQEWRNAAAKTKKHSFACARENERMQDFARIQSISQSQQNNNNNNNKSANAHHMTEKEANKLESRRRKAEDSSRRADTEFYTISVRAERARLEYESAIRKGAKQLELLEEERLSALKDLANVYLAHMQALTPRLQQNAERLSTPVRNCSVAQDIEILRNLTRRIEANDSASTEQLLPDFYAEHVTLAMNRERRKQALVRVLHLIRQDLNRERHGKDGLEALHRAFIKAPGFAADESTQNLTEQLHHRRSMLTYLEAARYKIGGALSEIEGGQRGKHPLAEYILVSRDKQGLQQSVLKLPSWVKNESFEFPDTPDELETHLSMSKEPESENQDWIDRTAGDGNSENPPDEDDFSDFDEFSSNSEDNNNQDLDAVVIGDRKNERRRLERCKAIYQYSANLNDELNLNPGDLITIHEKQADGWWIGECRGRTGTFPATYVQVI